MSISPAAARRALVAMQRFGLGPKPGLMNKIAKDPVKALLAELDTPGVAALKKSGLPSYTAAARLAQQGYEVANGIFEAERDARIEKQMSAGIGFVERLVMFWSNHFSMSVNKSEAIRGTVGQLERQVIRRHVLGRFENMLLGVMQHPAMIAFLDNDDSIGPKSPAGEFWGVGFNENLARESLELHTVGSGAFTEDDVRNYARILTGWSYVRGWEADGKYNGGTDKNRGQFLFRLAWHEPGPISLRGKRYPHGGVEQGRAALRDLAASPETAENIAFKLIRHFITDTPKPARVDALADVFLKSKGNLKAVAKALVTMPGALDGKLTKFRTPYEIAIGQFRATGRRFKQEDEWSYRATLEALKNVPFHCPSPEGYSDESAYWLAPDAMTIRLDTALLNTRVYFQDLTPSPYEIALSLFGPALTKPSMIRILRAEDKDRGLATLFMTPEFQRR
jgi:uncharacterized protein (DUF1800 family)